MNPVLAANLVLLWAVVLLLMVMMFAVVRYLRSISQILNVQMSSGSGSVPKLTIGKPAPDFIAFNHSGQQVTLFNYLGNNIVFIFISPHCEPCRGELPELVKMYPMAKLSGVDMILVTMTPASDMTPLIKEYKILFPVLYSPPQLGTLTDTYNPSHIYPFYCLLDENGIITSTDIIGGGEWPTLIQKWKMTGEQPYS